MDDHSIEPAAKPLADELRQGLHIAESARKGDDGDRGDRMGLLRCVQAALLRIADRIYEVDRRRADGLQYVHQTARADALALHERCSGIVHRLEVIETRIREIEDAALEVKLFDAGRQDAIRERRDLEKLERGEKIWWMEIAKLGAMLLGMLGTVATLTWGLLKLMLSTL